MTRPRIRVDCAALTVVLLTAFTALTLRAAPFAPVQASVTPTVRSLAELKRMRIEMEAVMQAVEEVNVSLERLREVCTGRLEQAGYAVVEEPDAPLLRVNVTAVLDEGESGMCAYGLFLTLEQMATVPRIDLSGRMPTFAANVVGIEARENVKVDVEEAAKFLINWFLRDARAADLMRKRRD